MLFQLAQIVTERARYGAAKETENLLKGGLSRKRCKTIGQTGNFYDTYPICLGSDSSRPSTCAILGVVCSSRMEKGTRFIYYVNLQLSNKDIQSCEAPRSAQQIMASDEGGFVENDVDEQVPAHQTQTQQCKSGQQFSEGRELVAVLEAQGRSHQEPLSLLKVTQRAEAQKLNCSSRLQLMNSRMKMPTPMKQMMSMTLRYMRGSWGSAHLVTISLNLQPIRNRGIVKLLANPTSPDSPVSTTNTFQPMASSVQLPRHHISSTPRMRAVRSWQTNGAVNSLQNSQCFRCQGRSTSPQRAQVGILRKGGQGATNAMQMMTLMAMRTLVKDLSLQQGASRLLIIWKKVSASGSYSLLMSCWGEFSNTVHTLMGSILINRIYNRSIKH